MYYIYGKEFNKKDNWINIKNKKYKIHNKYLAVATANSIDDKMTKFVPPLK